MIGRLFIGMIVFFLSIAGVAAQTGNLRCIVVPSGHQHLSIDSIFFDPASLTVSPQTDFTFVSDSATLIFSKPLTDTVTVCFRVFSLQVGQVYRKRDREEYFEDISQYQKQIEQKEQERVVLQAETLFPTDNIDKMGSISRSVSFGNSQNVFVNSSLNLQLEGMITDNINLEAVITDQNVPFQPEGNTQQIRDFDNVHIRLYNDDFDFTAGDVVLQNQSSHFLKYYKNVQGGQFSYNYNMGKAKAVTRAALSVAKGQFASVNIAPLEGVQGPYRVRGPNNERFVIIMANSERLFLDGKLLERGFDRDYIIDYNLAEITFNPGVLITKFSRIRVDYEYADQNYSRSILSFSHEQKWEKLRVSTELYRERDNPNQPLLFSLTDADKVALSEAGSQSNVGMISGADSVGFSQERILYAKQDTIVNNNRFEIYQFSTDPNQAFFAVTFSEVGFANGNYVLVNSSLNGRVFEWVAPSNGIPQGNFEPEIAVPTPNQKQLWVNRVGYQLDPYQTVFTELALSNHNQNLYAPEQSSENTGWASRSGYRIAQMPVGKKGYLMDAEASFEYNNESFRAIDRFRYIEFDRDWSFDLQDSLPGLNENIATAEIRLAKSERQFVDYKVSARNRSQVFSGWQHQLQGAQKIGNLHHRSDAFLLKSSQGPVGSTWERWSADTYYETKYVVPGYRYNVDRNKVFFTENDSIFSTAMNFSEHLWYIKTNDTLQNQLRLDYAMREDLLPVEGILLPQNKAHTWSLRGLSKFGTTQRLQYNFTYRRLKNQLDPSLEDEVSTMGRLDWSGAFLKRIITSELTYAISNSRELRREFIFIRVNNGEGTHTWRDDNGDGVQDLTEFYLAVNPDERNYIKIFTPTDEYILAYNNVLNYRINIDLPRAWQKQGGFKALMGRLSNVTSVTRDSKTTSDDFSERYNPFRENIDDADIVALRDNIRSTFFINRGNPKFGMEAIYSALSSKQLLTNGIESKGQNAWNINTRFNVKREVTMQLRYETGDRFNQSDVLANRNYSIDFFNLTPQVIWQPSTQFRTLVQYAYKDKRNQHSESMGEFSTIQEYQAEIRWSKAIERSVLLNVRMLDITFEGEENSPVGYELLEALRPGTNFTWNLQWQQRLLNGLQVSLGYEGRKSPNQTIVHIGRMQVTALF